MAVKGDNDPKFLGLGSIEEPEERKICWPDYKISCIVGTCKKCSEGPWVTSEEIKQSLLGPYAKKLRSVRDPWYAYWSSVLILWDGRVEYR